MSHRFEFFCSLIQVGYRGHLFSHNTRAKTLVSCSRLLDDSSIGVYQHSELLALVASFRVNEVIIERGVIAATLQNCFCFFFVSSVRLLFTPALDAIHLASERHSNLSSPPPI